MGTAEKRRGDVVKTKITAPAEGLPGLPPPSDSDTTSGSFSDSSLSDSDSSVTSSGSDVSHARRRGPARRKDSPEPEKKPLRDRRPQEYDRRDRSRSRYEDNPRRFRSPASRSPPRRSPSSRRHSPPPGRNHVSHKRSASYSRSPSPRDRKRVLTERRDGSSGSMFKEEAKGGVNKAEFNGGARIAHRTDEIRGGKSADAGPAKGGSVSRVVNGKVALFVPPRKVENKRQGASDGSPENQLEGERKVGKNEKEGTVPGKGAAADGETTPLAGEGSIAVHEGSGVEIRLPGGSILEEGGSPRGADAEVGGVPRGKVMEEEGLPRKGVSKVPAGGGSVAGGTTLKVDLPEQEAILPSYEIVMGGDDVDSDLFADVGADVDADLDADVGADVDADVGDRSEEGRDSMPGEFERETGGFQSEGQQKRSSRWDRKAFEEQPLPVTVRYVEGVVTRDSPEDGRKGSSDAKDAFADEKGVVEEVGRVDGAGNFDEKRENRQFDMEETAGIMSDEERRDRAGEHKRYDRKREDDRFERGEPRRFEERRREDRNGTDRYGSDRYGNERGRDDRRGRFADDRPRFDNSRSRRDDRFADERGNDRRVDERRFEERRFDERRFDDKRFYDRRPIGRESTRPADRRSEGRDHPHRNTDSWQSDRARPPFREEKRPGYSGQRQLEDRGDGLRGKDYPPKAVLNLESDETMQADREERARRPAWGAQRGGGSQQPKEKWGHDMFAEVNEGGFKGVEEEDPDAKIEALLAL